MKLHTSKLIMATACALILSSTGILRAEEKPAMLYTISENPNSKVYDSKTRQTKVYDARSNYDFDKGVDSFMDFLSGHLEIGTRITKFTLEEDSTSDATPYLGTITALDDEQDTSPTKLFADIMINPYIGFEITSDKVAAKTQTGPSFGTIKSDGEVEMSGPILMLLGRFPNKTPVTPYAGIGYAFFDADFDEEAHWALGYPNPETYVAAGSPTTSRGRTREMDVDDDRGVVLMGGVMWTFLENWAIDVFVRTIDVEAEATFTRRDLGVIRNQVTGTFPLKHTSYGIGARFIF